MKPWRNEYLVYLSVVLAALTLASVFLYFGKWLYDPNRVFKRNVAAMAAEDYLADLRESTEFGCRTFVDRRPDILFLGDSHTYAGYDFNALSAIFETGSLSTCALGGFYLESFFIVADHMRRNGYFPKFIVLNTSPREFVNGRDKNAALTVHKSYLDSPYTPREFIQDLIKGTLGRSALDADVRYTDELKVAMAQRKRLAAIDPAAAARYIAEYPNRDFRSWTTWAERVEFTARVRTVIEEICAVVRQNGAHLAVVDIPESPALRDTIYRSGFVAHYASILSHFSCADLVIADPASAYGIDDRYFFNRFMLADFPYDRISTGERIGPDPGGRDIDYDLDHMNLVGAGRFTQRVGKSLQPVIRRALGPRQVRLD